MRSAEKSQRAEPNALRITMQYHSRNGMVYELERAGFTLDLHVAPDQPPGESFDAASQWRVGAQSSRAPDALVITERAATRTEALRRVGETWAACAQANSLPQFDWIAVEKVLLSVRAL
jgi:hypothetical protein